jgi:Peptidase M1 N-terminal domain
MTVVRMLSVMLRGILFPGFALIAFALTGTGTAAESRYSFDATPGKLPKTVVPTHYAIELEPDLEGLTLAGAEVVDIEVREPTAQLVLNAVAMTLNAASIDNEAKSAVIALDAPAETATLTFPQPLATGAHKLRIGFTAQINKFGRGLFSVEYPTDKGNKRMLASHFEPADARRMFPCWDEPAFKVTFALTVTVPRALTAVSNMPVAHEEPVTPELKQVAFAPTPKMSSYLVVLAVGEFERLTAQADGVAVSVVTTSGKREQGCFALDSAVNLLRYFNDYFGGEVSAAQARPDRGAGRLRWCHGELGRHHVLREPAPLRSSGEPGLGAPRHLQHPGARDGAPMVRQFRHHGLVGQHLAQRGLRQLDAGEGDRALLSAVADLAQRQRGEAIRHGPRRPALRAPDPATGGIKTELVLYFKAILDKQ